MAKTLFFTGAGALAASAFFITRGDAPEPVPTINPLVQTSVSQLYVDTCAKCHGQNGEGGGGGTKTLITEEKFSQDLDRKFFDAIKNGVPDMGMEAYGATMTDKQIWGQVVHIRELQAKGLRAMKGSPKPSEGGVYTGKRHNYRMEEVIADKTGLVTPWSVDWLPDGRMLITNRPGFIYVARGKELQAKVEGLPASFEMGQGGLMDVAVHPDYAKNGWVYLSYTEVGDGSTGMTKIVRGRLDFTGALPKWTGQQTIWEADKKFYTRAGVHFGSRIVFDGKGKIFFAVGERGGNMLAQEITTPFGKIYRLNEDGTEPKDNPFVGKEGAIKGIWSLGHRNQQGLVMDLQGDLWDTEHGPRGGDEVNRIVKAGNYGWPVVAWSINYNDAANWTPWPAAGQDIKQPAFRWLPSIGASGLDVAKGGAFPQWKGDLLAGGLSGANVDRLRMKDGKLVEREELIHGIGRVRDVAVGPDGYVYIVFNQPDRITRLMPAK